MFLTSDELFNLTKALAMSMGFLRDTGRYDEEKEMSHLYDLFVFVKSADVELAPGDGDDGSNVKQINELLKQRQQRQVEGEAGNVVAFPGRFRSDG